MISIFYFCYKNSNHFLLFNYINFWRENSSFSTFKNSCKALFSLTVLVVINICFSHFLVQLLVSPLSNVSFLYSPGSLVSLHPFNVSIEQRTHRKDLTEKKKGGGFPISQRFVSRMAIIVIR